MADRSMKAAKLPAGMGAGMGTAYLKPAPEPPTNHVHVPRPDLTDHAVPECMFCGETVVGHHDSTLVIPVQFRFIPGKGVVAIPHPDVKLIYDVLPNGQVYFYATEVAIGGPEDYCSTAHSDCHNAAITGEYGHFEDIDEESYDFDGRRSRDEDFIGDTEEPDEVRGVFG